MYWADEVRDSIVERFAARIAKGERLVVRDEKTASGRVHVGSLRGVAIHDEVARVLRERGANAAFLYEINDFDPMDGIPSYLDRTVYEPYFGRPLKNIPAPEKGAENFAEFYASEFKEAIAHGGFEPEYYRASELYTSGKMNAVIFEALEHADLIRDIYKRVSGSEKPEGWLPIHMVCKQCGSVLATEAIGWDGSDVQYVCKETSGTAGAVGCGYEGSASPFDGNAKLPWKVEWAAKWKVVGVDIEGAGKDHSTKGGSRDVANHISREVFHYEPPFDIPYEFFLVGGAKMSSSKGRGSSAYEVAQLLPRAQLRLAFLGVRPMRAINFDPSGTTIPTLFDRYDDIAEKYWGGVDDDDARLFVRVHNGEAPERHYRMRFSLVSFILQMPHMDIVREAEKEKGGELTGFEKEVLDERVAYATEWIAKCAPSRYVYTLQQGECAYAFSEMQRTALARIAEYVRTHETLDGAALHEYLHRVKTELGIEPKELFVAIYQLFLGRDSGPQAGWFLSVLDREYILTRLKSVAL